MLGKGATGNVYQGVHKKTGEPVAVKAFNPVSHLRPLEVQVREFEVMKKLNQENIVKMLDIEEEVESQKKVLIMELCTGGSLYTILDDPQNSYGLEEEEFLCVLKDLSAGMKYLRDNNIIHRDLKPGNIMKFITDDGRSIYKLTDFGAARELEDDQQFMSLYGTEEYLHPDMYERAVLRHPALKPFRATVDLWSIGVTLYHVATGSLPFRPYGGRKNRETMHYITTKKASGVISGVQHSENGPIEWNKELPKTCLLNQGLRELVTALLAGILECNDDKMWTFDQFFESVQDIISRKVFHVFYMNEGKEISIYMQPDKVLKDLKDQVACQVNVPSNNQLLLFNNSVFESQINCTADMTSYPSTMHLQPLILLHTENTDVKDLTRLGALSACFPMFHSTTINTDHDAALAKTCCSVAHAVKRLVEKLVRCRKLLLQTPKILLALVAENVTKLVSSLDTVVQPKVLDHDRRFSRLEACVFVVTDFLSLLPNGRSCENERKHLSQILLETKQTKDMVDQKFCALKTAISNLEAKVLITRSLQKQWDQAMEDCIELKGCIEKADTYVNKIRESWQALVRDKSLRTLSFPDEQFHILEKVKVQQTSKKLLNLLQEECLKSCLQASHKLDEWYSGMQATMVQNKCLEDDLSAVVTHLKHFATTLGEGEVEVDACTTRILSTLKKDVPTENTPIQNDAGEQSVSNESSLSKSQSRKPSVRSCNSPSSMEVKERLLHLKAVQLELSRIVTDNDFVINKLLSLSQRHNSDLTPDASQQNGFSNSA